MRFLDSRRFLLTCCRATISVASAPMFHQEAPAMAGQIAVKPRPKTPSKVEWKALPRATGHSTIVPWCSHVHGRPARFCTERIVVSCCFFVSWCSKASKGTPCKGLLSDLKGQNAALQEIFWEDWRGSVRTSWNRHERNKEHHQIWTSDPVCMFCHLRNAWCFFGESFPVLTS